MQTSVRRFDLASNLKLVTLFTLAVIFGCAPAFADILYRETFGTATTGGQTNTQAFDWAVHTGATAVNHSDDVSTAVAINRTASGSKPGASDPVGQVNAGAVIGATPGAYGAGIAFTTTAQGNALFWTPEYPLTSGTGAGINPNAYSEIKFSWYQGNAGTDSSWRLAVQVGGQWYASQQTFVNNAGVSSAGNFALGGDDGNGGASHGAELKSFTYSTNATAWFLINFDGSYSTNTHTGTSGTMLTLGAQPGSNLTGNINAFGLFSSVPGTVGNRRFDTFLVEGIPAPVGAGKDVTWTGATDSDWNTATFNWLNLGNSTNFAQGDIARFDDSLTVPGNNNINLTGTLVPASVTVSNDAVAYTFSGVGAVGGAAKLLKQGTGTLTVTSENTYSGGTTISNGTVQIGDGGASGSLGSGNITNHAALTFNRNNDHTLANAISGSGSVTQNGTGAAVLTGVSSYTGPTVVNAGTLIVNGILNGGGLLTNATGTTLAGQGTNTGPVDISGNISPGTSPGTFTSGSLTLESGATATFELGSSTTVGGGVNDLLQVNGNLNLNNNTASIVLIGQPATGSPYRLINYTGLRGGTFASPATVVGGSRFTATPSYDDGAKQVNLTFSGSPASVTWSSTTGSEWDKGTSSHWLNQGTLLTDKFYDFDSVLFDDTVGVQTTVDIGSGIAVRPNSIVVNAANNVFTIAGAGGITGATSILKRGPATLTLGGVNNHSGGLIISNGVVRLSSLTAAGAGLVTVHATGAVVASASHTNAISLVGGTMGASVANIGGFSGNITAAAGTTSTILMSDPEALSLNAEMIYTGNLQGSGNLMVSSGDNNTTVDAGIGFRLRGTGASSFSGTITLSNNVKGELQTSVAGPFSPGGSGKIVLVCGAYDGGGVATAPASGGFSELNIRNNFTNHTYLGNNVELAGAGWANLNPLGSAPTNAVSTMGNLRIGGGQELGVIRNGGQPQVVAFQSVTLTGGDATFSPKTPGFGAATATGSDLSLSNITQLANSGVIMNGLRTLYLTGTNGFTGNTTISNGVLSLLGVSSLSNSPVITIGAGASLSVTGRVGTTLSLVSGQTLRGNGAVVGNVTIGAGATLSPGESVGALNVSGNLQLLGTSTMEVDKQAVANDQLQCAGTLTYGGTLVVTALNDPFSAGDQFPLFSAGLRIGSFAAIVPATPGANLAWDTNTLTADGILRVVSTAALGPQIQSVALAGGNIIVSGANGTQGNDYYVLTSTNVGLTRSSWERIATNQFTIGGGFSFTNSVNPATPQRFYLLQLP